MLQCGHVHLPQMSTQRVGNVQFLTQAWMPPAARMLLKKLNSSTAAPPTTAQNRGGMPPEGAGL